MYERIIEKLRDKSIAILGFGREGKSTYSFIRKHLPDKELTILDKNPVELYDSNTTLVIGDRYLDDLDKYDLIIKSPGISLKDIDITNIKNKITSQLELILEEYRSNIIGITGTKGKSTTTTLTYEVIKNQKDDVYLLGNIGIPIFDDIEKYNEKTILVIEMSSHQLEFVKASPHIAVILNLFEDHLDHAGTLEHYHSNKMNIFKYQDESDYSLYSLDNSYLAKRVECYPYKGIKYDIRFDNSDIHSNAVRIDDNKIILNDEVLYVDDVEKRKLIGEHNLKNIMFVVTIAKILKLDLEKAREVILNFTGLKYRMENIGTYDGVTYYNDTIATIPAATISAITAIKNVDTLIFGGLDRGIDYSELIEYLEKSNIGNLVCMPTTGVNIGKKLIGKTKENIYFAQTLEEAYKIAKENTKIGGSVLLSPAAASYEFYKNFEEKGKAFESLVKNEDIQ